MNRPTSVIDSDQDALRKLIGIHAPPITDPNSGLKILDVTYNVGRMWAGVPYTPHRMDINPKYELDTVGSFLALAELFSSGSSSSSSSSSSSGFGFDVIVFDPPPCYRSRPWQCLR